MQAVIYPYVPPSDRQNNADELSSQIDPQTYSHKHVVMNYKHQKATPTCQRLNGCNINASRHKTSKLWLMSSVYLTVVAVITIGVLLPLTGGQSIDPKPSLDILEERLELFVRPNSQHRLECKVPSTATAFWWSFTKTTSSNNRQSRLAHDNKCLNCAKFGIQLEMDSATGAYDLIFNNITYELNDGIYFCEYADNDKPAATREIRLTVLIPPEAPSISFPAARPAQEGHEFELACHSGAGNPEPNITWFKNDQPLAGLSSGGLHKIEQSKSNGTTTSLLTWLPTMEDHESVFKCSVWNQAMGLSPQQVPPLEREHRLKVEYYPRISVGPNQPLKVVQGSQTTLSCSVDANPSVKGVKWFRDGQHLGNQYNLTIYDLKPSDAGIYSCQADNGIPAPGGQHSSSHSSLLSLFGLTGSSSNERTIVESQLHLQVQYGPKVQVRPSKSGPLNESEFFSLNCSWDAVPPVHEVVWTRQDDPNFRRVASPQNPALEFQSLVASDMATYICTAYNRLDPSSSSTGMLPIERSGSGSGQILVRHRPGLAEIVLGNGGETELGLKTELQCKARPSGYPQPSFRFWRLQSNGDRLALNKQTAGAGIYTIFSARPEDEALYGCEATNELGVSSEAHGELRVNEVPSIIPDSNRRLEDARQPGSSPYSITVRAHGRPEPKVTWYHRSPIDGRRVELFGSDIESRFSIETVAKTSGESQLPLGQGFQRAVSSASLMSQRAQKATVMTTLTFRRPLEVDDRGLYTVEFSNGLSRVAQESFQLHIHHSPVPAPRYAPLFAGQPQQQNHLVKAGFETGEPVNLTCRVSAYPKPEFSWFSAIGADNPQSIDTNSRYRTAVSNPYDDIWESVLYFQQAQESDFGDYICASANPTPSGSMSESVQVTVKLGKRSLPDPPTHLMALDATQDSVTIQWVAGFDGGFGHNQFLVQYAPDDGSNMPLSRRFPQADQPIIVHDLATGNELGGIRFYECLSMNPCTINGLQARQAYVFRIRAKNYMGVSDYSGELRAVTRANMSQIPSIAEASFDSTRNLLSLRLEPGVDSHLLANLNAKIEVKLTSNSATGSQSKIGGSSNVDSVESNSLDAPTAGISEWRTLVRAQLAGDGKAEAYLNVGNEVEAMRVSLCSRSNETFCGPELALNVRGGSTTVGSSFLQDQRGLSISLLVSSLALIALLGAFATSLHGCCQAVGKKAKQLDAENREHQQRHLAVEAAQKVAQANAAKSSGGSSSSSSSSAGSTDSTKSTSAASAGLHSQFHSVGQQMNSINSINAALNGGSTPSAQSRPSKLDSLPPPNYDRYADRASILMDQQHHQHQLAQIMQQQMHDSKINGSPFGLLSAATIDSSAAAVPSHFNSTGNGGYTSQGFIPDNSSLMHLAEHSQFEQSSEWPHHQQQQQQQQQLTSDDAYNAYSYHQQMQLPAESTYGTVAAAYSAPASQPQSQDIYQQHQQTYMNAYAHPNVASIDRQQQYQAEIAAAQQQMYGTLTKNHAYQLQQDAQSAGLSSTIDNNNLSNQLLEQQQQQHYATAASVSSNGLMQVPPPPPPQESDYGTTRGGRLIREIIV